MVTEMILINLHALKQLSRCAILTLNLSSENFKKIPRKTYLAKSVLSSRVSASSFTLQKDSTMNNLLRTSSNVREQLF